MNNQCCTPNLLGEAWAKRSKELLNDNNITHDYLVNRSYTSWLDALPKPIFPSSKYIGRTLYGLTKADVQTLSGKGGTNKVKKNWISRYKKVIFLVYSETHKLNVFPHSYVY